MASGTMRIDTLTRENYDTWKMHMEALLIKNDAWDFVNGTKTKPEVVAGDVASAAAAERWTSGDLKAKSDIILSISASELKQVKGCSTSREVWLKLENIYQSRGPARKATLLKKLTLQRMRDGDDVREHLREFFDAVDKLNEMNIEINADLLAILLLYSLPANFENFRCAIESRDDLPTPEVLRVKILEEHDARKNEMRGEVTNAMIAGKSSYKNRGTSINSNKSSEFKKSDKQSSGFRFKCYRCNKIGHKAAECRKNTAGSQQSAKTAENITFYGLVDANGTDAMESAQGISREMQNNYEDVWCLDSGCSSHICKNREQFSNVSRVENRSLNLANNSSTEIVARGNVILQTHDNDRVKNIDLENTLLVPDARTNLLSVAKITDKGYSVVFEKNVARIVNNNGDTLLSANRVDSLYYIQSGDANDCRVSIEAQSSQIASEDLLQVWHRRLGHLNVRDLTKAAKNGTYKNLNIQKTTATLQCDVCVRGKMTRTPFPQKSNRCSEALQVVHTDVCGPMRTESHGKAKYYVTFIDDNSKWCEVRFVNRKSDVFAEFVKVKALMENQRGTKIKFLQSDNGTEYLNKPFNEFLEKHGIQRRLTVANNPEQNGTAERRNRTLGETARCLLIQSGLPNTFWAEAIHAANHIRNRCPSKSLNGKTPYEIWHGEKPDVGYLKEFGSKVFILDRSPGKGKFDSRSKEGILLGYAEHSKGYRVWLPKEKKIEISRDIKCSEASPANTRGCGEINEKESSTKTESSGHKLQVDIELSPAITDREIDEPTREGENLLEEGEEEQPEEVLEVPRRGPGRPRKIRTGKRGRPRRQHHSAHANTAQEEECFLAKIPVSQAVSGRDADEWYGAMATELKCILQNDTWELVERPEDHKVISSRVVLRNKFRPDGTLEKRKARIVARGFSQRPGLDFDETFSPVARLSSIRIAVALASQFGMIIEQVDVTSAYLNGILEEEIYMEVPEMTEEILKNLIRTERKNQGVRAKAEEMLKKLQKGDKVCLLRKALYGLRQAGRQWHQKLDQELKRIGATPSGHDPCIYFKGQGGDMTLITVYVDDILIASRHKSDISRIKMELGRSFTIKDLGEAKCCLGLEFTRHDDGYTIHQKGHIEEILNRFNMSECKPTSTPATINSKSAEECDHDSDTGDLKKLPYRELIGALLYLAMASRPDIAHTISRLSSFNDCYRKEHWVAAKRVLRYLKGTSDLGLSYRSSTKPITGFVDADWGNCQEDRRSYTGYAFILANGAVTWESRKQRTVALSSTEAEYMGITEAVKEAIYLRRFLTELGFTKMADVTLYCDNSGAQKLTANPVFHSRTKHIDIRHHFVREAVKEHKICLQHISTEEMAADILTKGLTGTKHKKCLKMLGMDQSPHNEGEC